jgi:hypothetical protein
MTIPTYPEKVHSMVAGPLPWVWCGTADRDGTASPWKDAPCGSQYTFLNAGTAAVHYVKIADADADADWAATTD